MAHAPLVQRWLNAVQACKASSIWLDVGRAEYGATLALQRALLQQRLDAVAGKQAEQHSLPDVVIATEHAPAVYTLGRTSTEANLLFDSRKPPLPVHRVERGGEVTYHGPGQLTVYPVLNLTRFKKDVRWYVHTLESVLIDTLAHWHLQGTRLPGLPGVFLTTATGATPKVAQVGIAASKWHTMHGIALNVAPHMPHFKHIVPCGIAEHAATSMAQCVAAGAPPLTLPAVKERLARHLREALGCDLEHVDPAADRRGWL